MECGGVAGGAGGVAKGALGVGGDPRSGTTLTYLGAAGLRGTRASLDGHTKQSRLKAGVRRKPSVEDVYDSRVP